MRLLLRTAVFFATVHLTHAWAVDTTLTQAGYTGLGITPNAHLIGWGRMEMAYDSQLPGIANPSGHNYVFGFGLLPNLEIAGRLATNDHHSNCFIPPGCGARDMSASGKIGIGLDAANRFRIAAGATDLGGAVTYFRSYYGVLTWNEGPFEISGGWAQRSGTGINGSKSPLDGPFAGAAWQPLPWARLHAEYSDGNGWAGLRLFAPREWLPDGWTAYVGANQRLNQNELTQKSWVSAGLAIPLYKVPALPGAGPKAQAPALQGTQQPLPAYEALTLPLPPSTAEAPLAASPPAATVPAALPGAAVADTQLQALATALQAKGLEDISVGRMPDGSVAVRVNNFSYNWNSLDALGAALGAVSRTLGSFKSAYRLVLTQRQVPLVAVTGQTDCLRQWLGNEAQACAAGQLSTPGTGALEPLLQDAQWVVQNMQPSWQTLRLQLSPILHDYTGSEFGAYDYSLGVNVGLLLPLWKGASIEWRQNVPVANSDDYDDGNAFAPRRIRAGLDRAVLTQTVRVPLERWLAPGDEAKALRWGLAGLTAQGTVGRVGGVYDGVLGALRWEPGEGRHRFGAQAGYFRNSDYRGGPVNVEVRRATPLLGSYRYSVMATRTDLEVTAGQFMYSDRGFRLGLRQWFSDVAVIAYVRRSQFDGEQARNFAGVEISLPIGPRRDMQPIAHVQVTGTPRFTHGVETTIRDDPGRGNPVRSGFGVTPPTPQLDATFNSDRAGLAYFEDNIRRIRDAAR